MWNEIESNRICNANTNRSQTRRGASRPVARNTRAAHAAGSHAERTARARLPQVPPTGRARRRGAPGPDSLGPPALPPCHFRVNELKHRSLESFGCFSPLRSAVSVERASSNRTNRGERSGADGRADTCAHVLKMGDASPLLYSLASRHCHCQIARSDQRHTQ